MLKAFKVAFPEVVPEVEARMEISPRWLYLRGVLVRGASVTGQNEDHWRHRSAVDVGSSVTDASVTKIGNLSAAF